MPPTAMKSIASALLHALNDPHASVRREALRALERLPSVPNGLGSLLARLAGDADLSVRREAVRLLGNARKDDHDIVHGLAAGLQDSDSEVRMEATMAFCYRSGWPPREAWLRSTFLEGLEDSNPRTRSLALRGIWQTDWRAESSMAAFLRHLNDEDLEVKRSAICGIFNVASNSPELARPAVPALLRALDDPQLAPFPAQALVKVAPAEPALQAYLKSLLDKVGSTAAALCLEARAHVREAVQVALADLRETTWDIPPFELARSVSLSLPRGTLPPRRCSSMRCPGMSPSRTSGPLMSQTTPCWKSSSPPSSCVSSPGTRPP